MVLDSSSLTLLPTVSNSSASDLVGILYGSSPSTGGNPVMALQTALRTETKAVAGIANEASTKRDIAAFRAAVASAKSPAALLANPLARKVLLTANGLGDQTDYVALVTKALLSDTSKTGSLASKLMDTRFLSVAKTYDFANKGLATLQDPKVLDSLSNGYAEVTWRQGLDKSTPGLSNALDFRSRAAGIASVDQILGDKTFREVVTVALGLPKEIAFQPLQTQELAISSRLDLGRLKSSAFVEQFAKRYLIAASTASTSSSQAIGVTSLFA